MYKHRPHGGRGPWQPAAAACVFAADAAATAAAAICGVGGVGGDATITPKPQGKRLPWLSTLCSIWVCLSSSFILYVTSRSVVFASITALTWYVVQS